MQEKRINGRRAQWVPCMICGQERWVLVRRGCPQSKRCGACRGKEVTRADRSGPNHPRWAGGKSRQANGYVSVWIPPDDPLAAMRGDKGRVYEHRLAVARSLGRPLGPDEEVHHINGRKTDNRLRNLRLLTKSTHAEWHANRIKELEREVRRLRRELRAANRP